MGKTANKKMGQELFQYLPSEIKLEILSRLPARTVLRFKSVCKPWLHLFATPEFIKSHISKSIPGLAVILEGESSKTYKALEFVDEPHLNFHLNTVFDFELPFHVPVHSSVDGLLFLCELGLDPEEDDLYICNPIKREYLKLPSPPPSLWNYCVLSWQETFGFGVSQTSGQYKVVRIFPTGIRPSGAGSKYDQFECQVYTVGLGSGSWRGIACATSLDYEVDEVGVFLKGSLHWLASSGSSVRISCLDLETELFSIFSTPLNAPNTRRKLSVLRDCLCVCDNSFGYDVGINIWIMKEYGDEKSWTREFIISKAGAYNYLGFRYPIKIFKDGNILIKTIGGRLLYYSSKTKIMREINLSGMDLSIFSSATVYAPSLLSLKVFEMEKVRSF